MFFQRIFTPRLAVNSYLLGDEKTKRCLVIDPTRLVVPYIMQAQDQGLEIVLILETHVHADFVSGAKELKHQLNEKPAIYASGLGGKEWIPAYADHIVQEGDQIAMGSMRLESLHTPGHTPEHLMWICYDETRSRKTPCFAFTGDCLFVDSVGRPDLLGKEESKALAQQLYHTLFETLAPLPDFLEIFPGHGAGSLCGKALSGRATSTLGYERLFNPYLKKTPQKQWITTLEKDLPVTPPHFKRIKALNVAGPSLMKELKTYAWKENEDKIKLEKLFLVDTRHPEIFASLHLAHALNIPFSDSFYHWAGWMTPDDQPLGLVVDNPHVVAETVDRFRLLGFDQDIWIIEFPTERTMATDSFPLIEVEELATHHPAFEKLHLIDVRSLEEWQAGHIPGAQHIPLETLEAEGEHLSKEKPMALICKSGFRGSLATSLLQKQGFKQVKNVRGGIVAWKQASLPLSHL